MSRIKKLITFPLWVIGLPIWIISGFFSKKKNLWIFGAWYGKQYSDNSRALFERVNETRPDVQAVWFTRDKKIIQKVQALGYQAVLAYSLKGFWLAFRANIAFVSSGMSDVNKFAANADRIVQLWHGIPIKKIGDDTRSGIYLYGYRLLRIIFPFIDPPYDYFMTTSAFTTNKSFISAFPRVKKFLELGFPRNDVLAENNEIEDDSLKDILYLPTFRAEKNDSSVLFEKFDPDSLQKILEETQSYFIIKLHPIQVKPNLDLSNYSRIKFSDSSDDTYQLLKKAAILITDYSSVYIDFLLTDRPIIHLAPDIEEYCQNDRGLYFPFKEVAAGEICECWQELEQSLLHNLNGNDEYSLVRKTLSDQFYLNPDAGSARRIIDFLESQNI